ncbi:DUF3500 domain-containing protein [Streptomyces sp. AC555_RSS877]|uniref:DUF3500 domain-containing protein n=1 Tax=Streptomyces sp. AC555_RSS877 TaxID=2823688 RepID=UPI001C26E281|nr:DUF3500 domain-containing protein [Streptomyces sp. AC555_RSS877]
MAITVPPRGVSARDLDEEQRHGLRRLLCLYTGRAPQDLAEDYGAHYASDSFLDEVHFSWADSLDAGEPHPYRLHGPRASSSSTTRPNGRPTTPTRYDTTRPPTSAWTSSRNTGTGGPPLTVRTAG